MTYFANGTATTQLKRDRKAALLASVEAGNAEALYGMARQDMITMLAQDIADYDSVLARLRPQDGA